MSNELIETAKRAERSIYIAAPEEVAKEISGLIRELREALQQPSAPAEWEDWIRRNEKDASLYADDFFAGLTEKAVRVTDLRARLQGQQDRVCATCNGVGMIGGPVVSAGGEVDGHDGEPCPDCSAPEGQQEETDMEKFGDHSNMWGDYDERQGEAEPERVDQLLAHRATHAAEHNPEQGKLHGYCIVCGVPWPCSYAGTPPAPATHRELINNARLAVHAVSLKLDGPVDVKVEIVSTLNKLRNALESLTLPQADLPGDWNDVITPLLSITERPTLAKLNRESCEPAMETAEAYREMRAAAKKALNALRARLQGQQGEAEPVAWIICNGSEDGDESVVTANHGHVRRFQRQGHEIVPLYTKPAPTIPEPEIDDWCQQLRDVCRSIDVLSEALGRGEVDGDGTEGSILCEWIEGLTEAVKEAGIRYDDAGKLSAPTIPEGWKCVPVEPTLLMLSAGKEARCYGHAVASEIYKAMVAAAPDSGGDDAE